MPYSASLIAYILVKRAIDAGRPVTQMKLQKMLYFAQGIHLVANDNEPLFTEQFQAWKYGPVIPLIYQRYKFYGSKPIADMSWLNWWGESESYDSAKINDSAKQTIQTTWESTKDINAIQLSNWTHKEGSPWAIHYKEGMSDEIIPNDEIAEYFKQFLVK